MLSTAGLTRHEFSNCWQTRKKERKKERWTILEGLCSLGTAGGETQPQTQANRHSHIKLTDSNIILEVTCSTGLW